eukprot:CAMPEP_0119055920 /NCGR_PEP_ID=MMETSP1178-20130426/633_1 /TAXON_ID=33656 /ORGANISM="unid sp, Strain CCMP2000" /LENGTH=61 /DNA_ID=CAMNT_0007036587 /DNA_START=15 /DNA_END=198 /DNA_ORIENTATION=+
MSGPTAAARAAIVAQVAARDAGRQHVGDLPAAARAAAVDRRPRFVVDARLQLVRAAVRGLP